MSHDLQSSDDPLDRQLREVPIPSGLRARLTTDIWADEEIDRRLNDVAIPFGLKYRMREIASTPHWRSRGMVAAAALFLIVSCWQVGTVLRNFYLVSRPERIVRQPLDSEMYRPEEPILAAAAPQSDPVLYYRPFVLSPVEVRYWRPVNSLADALDFQRRDLTASHARLTARPLHRPTLLDRMRPLEMIAAATAGRSLDGVRGAPPTADGGGVDFSDVRPFTWRMPRGVDPALGADERRFLLETGSFPFVQPRDFPTSSVPLVLHTTAFETARQSLAAGEAPPVDRMRTEEFLAAADYRFPTPPAGSPLRLSAYGAIAPWVRSIGVPAAASPAVAPAAGTRPNPAEPVIQPEQIGRLLQLGVQAGSLPAVPLAPKPIHLTVGVDVSPGMQFGGRLEMVKRSLRAAVGKMRGSDRMTIVALGGSNPTIIEDAGRAELDQLLAAVDWLSAAPNGAAVTGNSTASGVIEACRVAARREPPRDAEGRLRIDRRVMIFTDSCGQFDPRGVREAERLLATRVMEGVRVDLVDVTGENEETAWEESLRSHGGRVFRADSVERMRSALMEGLTGRSQRLASDVVLSITFNPQAVVGYRLIGHEPTALAVVAPPKLEMDFNAGQTGSMLFEVRLNGSKETQVAIAVLRWRDPTDGTPHEVTLPITRGMLGGTWEKAGPSLQMAAIATATAARLRNSPWADHVAPSEVLQWARRLDRSRTGRELEPWLSMLEQIQKLPAKRGASRGGR
jgi:Ca-activated chloride channel homolog